MASVAGGNKDGDAIGYASLGANPERSLHRWTYRRMAALVEKGLLMPYDVELTLLQEARPDTQEHSELHGDDVWAGCMPGQSERVKISAFLPWELAEFIYRAPGDAFRSSFLQAGRL